MSSCQPASSAPLLPLLAPQLNSFEISQAMNIFALLVPLLSPPHPWHPCPLPGIAFCQCIDPTCILWSKLAFDIYAGCQADGQRLKILPLLSPSLSPATPLDHCHQRELDKEREGEMEWGNGASSICACYCHLCVLFLFSFAFLTQPFFLQSLLAKLSIPGSPSGFGAAVSTFLAISVATETIQSSPANAPRRAFSFCYLCI